MSSAGTALARLLARAESLIALEQWDLAEQLYRQALTEDRQAALLGLGETATLRGEAERALTCYDELLGAAPGCVAALLGRGRALLVAGRPDAALIAFDGARRDSLEPSELAALEHGRGLALRALGRASEAEEAQQTAVEAAPDLYEAWIELGDLLTARGRYEGGLHAFGQALALDGERIEGVLRCARLLRAVGDHDEAAAVLERAAEGVLADEPELLYELACTYVATHQLDALGGLALRLQTALPSDPASLHQVAVLLALAGLTDLAREYAEQGLLLDPSPTERTALQRLLEELAGA